MARIIWTIYFFIPSAAAPINFPFFVLLAFAVLNLFMQAGADVQRFPLLFLAKKNLLAAKMEQESEKQQRSQKD